jgi:hypothetical protein
MRWVEHIFVDQLGSVGVIVSKAARAHVSASSNVNAGPAFWPNLFLHGKGQHTPELTSLL